MVSVVSLKQMQISQRNEEMISVSNREHSLKKWVLREYVLGEYFTGSSGNWGLKSTP